MAGGKGNESFCIQQYVWFKNSGICTVLVLFLRQEVMVDSIEEGTRHVKPL